MATGFQVNLAVRDIDTSIEFYRLLGLELADASEWPKGSGAHHVDTTMPGGQRFALDDYAMISIWHPGFTPGAVGMSPVVSLQVDARSEVDDLAEKARMSGHQVAVEPYDAFWGSRYAVVVDPDGHHVGLRSPVEDQAQHQPYR